MGVIIVPFPKIKSPRSLNEYRPEAPKTVVIIFEKTIKDVLLNIVQANLDPFQFDYRRGRVMEDATPVKLVIKQVKALGVCCGAFSTSPISPPSP